MKFDTNREKGNSGLAMAIAYYGTNGYIISLPLNDTQDYDLIIDNGEKDSKQKNTGSHGDNGSQGKHPVSFDIFDTLFQSVPDCTRPHDILPLSRHL